MFSVIKRLDREGLAIARQVASAVERQAWPQVAWLTDNRPVMLAAESQRGVRRVRVDVSWDMDPWASDTRISVRVEAIVAGRRLPWSFAHHQQGNHDGRKLPEQRPSPATMNLAVLLPRISTDR